VPLLDADRSLVLVIDMQGELVHQVDRAAFTLAATHRLLEIADLFSVPVLLTEQYPRGLGTTEPDLLVRFENLTTVHRRVEKTSFSCCGAPSFEAAFEELVGTIAVDRRQVVVAGIEAHICVVQTVLGLLERGCEVQVCWECVSGRGAEYREWALDRMCQAGATVTNHESAGFEWARGKEHPSFRGLNRLLRGGQISDDEERPEND
jgi:nicotinamidase-related amidase